MMQQIAGTDSKEDFQQVIEGRLCIFDGHEYKEYSGPKKDGNNMSLRIVFSYDEPLSIQYIDNKTEQYCIKRNKNNGTYYTQYGYSREGIDEKYTEKTCVFKKGKVAEFLLKLRKRPLNDRPFDLKTAENVDISFSFSNGKVSRCEYKQAQGRAVYCNYCFDSDEERFAEKEGESCIKFVADFETNKKLAVINGRHMFFFQPGGSIKYEKNKGWWEN